MFHVATKTLQNKSHSKAIQTCICRHNGVMQLTKPSHNFSGYDAFLSNAALLQIKMNVVTKKGMVSSYCANYLVIN